MAKLIEENLQPKRIRALDTQLVNRIAAGEIIQRPFNALKELIENCLDAGSTSINIQIKDGGLKLIQITDNGCGIAKDDLMLICERFTTSKLEKFEDLSSINTFGFRGEALASISHVSRLTITTKTANSQCGFKASYIDGKMVKDIQPCAMSARGTQITVEDLFYNSPLRKNALKTSSDEFAKIYEVVSRYAIHNYHCSFFLKRLNESGLDLKTVGCANSDLKGIDGNVLASRCHETEKYLFDTIASIFGSSLKEKVEKISIDFDEKYRFEMQAYMTNAKLSTFILFINERLVDCQPLKKTLQNIFAQYLPKNDYFFVYINLKLDPNNLDVNVHPTKHEVRFLYQDEIVNKIQTVFEQKFLNSASTRTYYVQNLTLDAYIPGADSEKNRKVKESTGEKKSSQTGSPIIYPYQLTRVDSKDQKLESFLHQTSLDKSIRSIKENNNANASFTKDDSIRSQLRNQSLSRVLDLKSLNELKKSVEKNTSKEARTILQDISFIGCMERELALVQHQTSLYILNTRLLSQELFYQVCLFGLGNFGYFKLEHPLSLYDLTLMALNDPDAEWTPDNGPRDILAKKCAKFLNKKAQMLDDYFSIKIKSVKTTEDKVDYFLEALPMLIEDYEPDLTDLPIFMIRLINEVDWENEKECLNTISQQIAYFYSIKNEKIENEPSQCESQGSVTSQNGNEKKPTQKWLIEHVLYKAFKNVLLPSKELEKKIQFKLVDLSALYRVFERC